MRELPLMFTNAIYKFHLFLICPHTHASSIPPCITLLASRVGPGQSQDGRPDAAGSGVGGPVGGTLSSGLKKYSQIPNLALKPSRSPNNPQFTIGSFIIGSFIVAANENVFSVNLPGKITDK